MRFPSAGPKSVASSLAGSLAIVIGLSSRAEAATFTVTSTADSGAGTLRQAIIDANGSSGTDTIAFSVTGPGPHTIAPTSALPTITDPVVIDGTTEPDFSGSPIVEIDGTSAGGASNGLIVTAGSSTIRALVINRFGVDGILITTAGGNTIEGCYVGTDVTGKLDRGNGDDGIDVQSGDNVVGGTSAGSACVVSGNGDEGVQFTGVGATNNRIEGSYVGCDVDGALSVPNGDDGVLIASGASGNRVGGAAPGAGNVLSGNADEGVEINASDGNFVEGNLIGVTASGTTALPNADDGLKILSGASDNVVGGASSGARNVISGNVLRGVAIESAGAARNKVVGNRIGTDASAVLAIGNGTVGVQLSGGGSDNEVGGVLAGEGNVIAHNGSEGVAILAGTGNAVRANVLKTNGALGIDLGTAGVTANDAGDGDTGANDLQNFPVLTRARTNGTDLFVDGTLDSAPSSSFDVDYFASAAADPSGNGEGERYLGSDVVVTDGGGSASFTTTLSVPVADGEWVTVTATDATGNTSELSAALEARELRILKRAFLLDGTPVPDGGTLPSGTLVKFVLYVNNRGGALTDVTLEDTLDAAFVYETGTIRTDASLGACGGATCTPAEEAAIFAAVDAGAPATDGVDGDVAGLVGAVVHAGDGNVGNARLDVPAARVFAIVFTVKIDG